MGCLCGCGSNNQRCLLPNRPPSPNTFWENWWAPEFAYMLKNRLEKVAMRLEPSKRIWWREEFGGCAPDREPLDSEIWSTKYEDRGNVLRTSPPAFEDQPQASQQNQSSNGLPNTRNSSPDEEPTVRRKPRPLKSPTHYIPDKFPPLRFHDPTTRKALQGKPREYTAEEDEQLLQSALRMREANNLERHRLYGIPLEQGKVFSTRGSPSISQKNQCVRAPNSISDQDKASGPEEHQQVKQSPTDDYLTRFRQEWNRQEWNGSPPLLARGITYPDDQRESVSRGPSVRPRVRSPKSPTHYIPDKFPVLHFPDPATIQATRRKPKVYTAEEKEQFLQSALRKQKLQLEQLRLYGISLDQGGRLPAESSIVPNNIPFQDKALKPEEYQQAKQSPIDDYPARLRQDWNSSPPLPVRPKVKSPKSPTHYISDRPPPLKIPDFSKEHPARRALRMEKKPIVEDDDQLLQADDPWPVKRVVEVMRLEKLRRQEHKLLKKSLYQKIAAMKLRRSQRHGITIHQSENASSASPHSLSHVDPVEEELSVFPVSEKLRQLEPSLLEKIEAMRLRRSRRHGTAIHQSEASVPMGSDSSPRHVEVREIPSKIEPQPRSSEASPQQVESSLWKKIEAMKQRLSRRQCTAIYQAEEPKDQGLAPPSKVDQATGVLLGTQVHKQNLMLDRPPNIRVHSCQDFEAGKLGRSSRQGIARSV